MCLIRILGILLAVGQVVLGSTCLQNTTTHEDMTDVSHNYAIYSLVLSILLLCFYEHSFSLYKTFYSLKHNMNNARRTFNRSLTRLRIRLPSIPYIVTRRIKQIICTILVVLYIIILYTSIWFSLFDVGTCLTLAVWIALLTKPLNELVLNFTEEISLDVMMALETTHYIVMIIGFVAIVFFWMLNGVLTMYLGILISLLPSNLIYSRPRSNRFLHMNGSAFQRLVNPPAPDRELPFHIRMRLEEDQIERERIRNEARGVQPELEENEMNNEIADPRLYELRNNETNEEPMALDVNEVGANEIQMANGGNEVGVNAMHDAEMTERDYEENINKGNDTPISPKIEKPNICALQQHSYIEQKAPTETGEFIGVPASLSNVQYQEAAGKSESCIVVSAEKEYDEKPDHFNENSLHNNSPNTSKEKNEVGCSPKRIEPQCCTLEKTIEDLFTENLEDNFIMATRQLNTLTTSLKESIDKFAENILCICENAGHAKDLECIECPSNAIEPKFLTSPESTEDLTENDFIMAIKEINSRNISLEESLGKLYEISSPKENSCYAKDFESLKDNKNLLYSLDNTECCKESIGTETEVLEYAILNLAEFICVKDIESQSTNSEDNKTEDTHSRSVCQIAESSYTESSKYTPDIEGSVNLIDLFFIYNTSNACKRHSLYC